MKIAICLSGAMAKITNTFYTQNALYTKGEYVNFKACHNSIIKHIVDANSNCSFDFFIHSWNVDLQDHLNNLYFPKKSLFEDNSIYTDEINGKVINPTDFGLISRSLSIKKNIELVENYQLENNIIYDLVILYRPDLIIIKNISISNYDLSKIYVNGNMPQDPIGDFHFIMNAQFASQFKNLYSAIEQGNRPKAHFWMKNFITQYMGQELLSDDIVAGLHQEVLRKIYVTTISKLGTPIETFFQYGLTKEDILKYIIP